MLKCGTQGPVALICYCLHLHSRWLRWPTPYQEEKRRGVERTQSAPLAPLVITCSGQALLPHQQPPPSPTSSIASGRHTTRVLIKSPPPPPPPRKNTTSLSSRSSFHPQQQQVSPPASPAHSSSSSSGVGSSCGSSAAPRRCKSIGSLSASSGESAVWEDSLIPTHPTLVNTHSGFRSSMPPPTPPKPPAHSAAPMSSTNSPYTLGGVPPPPPPPPPLPTSTAKPSLAAALSKELERRSAQVSSASLNSWLSFQILVYSNKTFSLRIIHNCTNNIVILMIAIIQ